MTGEKLYYKASDHVLLRPFLRSPVISLLVHWVFQGMLYMDRTELMFKIGLDLAMATVLWIAVSRILRLPKGWAVVPALLIAHTMNFMFNGQVWSVLKCFHLVKHSRSEFDEYLRQLSERIEAEPSIEWAGVYGSPARGEWTEYSDLDLRLVRRSGLWNGLCACWFVLCERTRALIHKFPLDLFLLDSPKMLAAMRNDEPPLELLAPGKAAQPGSRGRER